MQTASRTPSPICFFLFAIAAFILAACGGGQASGTITTAEGECPNNATLVSIIYAPESAQYLPQAIADFNRESLAGRNPVTGVDWPSGTPRACVTGVSGSSGTVMQGLVNAVIAPNNSNVAQPVIFAPSVSHWLALANYQTGRPMFDLSTTQATALAPVVMAIWESRLNAIRQTVGYDEVGWEELIGVLNSPNGWCDYGIPAGECRRTVYYGHTDPLVSSTGLSTLIAEFYAAAANDGFTGRLTLQQVRDPEVQDGVRAIENLIRHYSSRTTEFKEYIAQGPEYLDFVALEENDLIYINRGLTQYQPPERLVALYPKEGTFWHEHPMGIVNAAWVTPEQRAAAQVFIDYVLTEPVQQAIMAQGFRPANPNVALEFPFVPENGIDPVQPRRVLDVPAPDVIAAVQQSWSLVKKQADILLVVDTSGSMENEDKIGQARAAAETFINGMEATNRVALWTFSDDVLERVPLGNIETVQQQMYSNIRSLRANGGTELFYAVQQAVEEMNRVEDGDRIRAIIVLSDGADTGSRGTTLNDAVSAIEASRDAVNPVIVIPVAYGSDADVNALNAIARASNTSVQSGSAENIARILELLGSFF
ncbi:MAG: extracellular solute-binding protein [bacterium]|nr:extracellular solute-binding protein [bacterium]